MYLTHILLGEFFKKILSCFILAAKIMMHCIACNSVHIQVSVISCCFVNIRNFVEIKRTVMLSGS